MHYDLHSARGGKDDKTRHTPLYSHLYLGRKAVLLPEPAVFGLPCDYTTLFLDCQYLFTNFFAFSAKKSIKNYRKVCLRQLKILL